MTSKEILDSIYNSTMKCDPDMEKRTLYESYFPIIEATLTFCPKDFGFDGFASLEVFKKPSDFEDFIRGSTAEEIKIRFECALSDMKTAKNAHDTIERASGAGVQSLLLRNKKKSLVSKIIIPIIAVLSGMIALFTVLEVCKVLDTGDAIAGICGVADFLFGVGFFIYEFLSDKKSKEISDKVDRINGQVVYNKNVKVKGNRNNFGIQNSVSDRARLASEFLAEVNNSEIKVKGNNNNFGIRD